MDGCDNTSFVYSEDYLENIISVGQTCIIVKSISTGDGILTSFSVYSLQNSGRISSSGGVIDSGVSYIISFYSCSFLSVLDHFIKKTTPV